MKKSHILILFFIAICIGVVASQLGNVSSYADFSDAEKKTGEDLRIKGTLADGKPVVYDPQTDANTFSFYMLDDEGKEKKVICNKEMPRDFEKLDEVVVTGSLSGDVFYAHDLVVKCPSKYVEEDIQKEGV
ncbi:MAG: cytochrome c maturation protein CcmE [Chitinophagales bacterium]|nr:cytochrome c maturation protein CcmE [Chitinophagales bacterium]